MMLIDAICICPIYVFNLYYTILYIYCHTERFYEDWEPSLHSHRLTVIWFSKTYQGCCLPNWRFKTKRWHPKFEPRYCAVGDWGQGPIIQRQAGTLLFHMVLGWFPTLFKSVLGSTNESALVAPLRSISISQNVQSVSQNCSPLPNFSASIPSVWGNSDLKRRFEQVWNHLGIALQWCLGPTGYYRATQVACMRNQKREILWWWFRSRGHIRCIQTPQEWRQERVELVQWGIYTIYYNMTSYN
jgi:hypothetical protein